MAKLNGVKTVDMVGGEVTKIAYEGVEYVRVEDGNPGEKGDIAKIVRPWGNQEKGEFYPVINEDHVFYEMFPLENTVYISGKTCDASDELDSVELFRKVTEQSTLDERVTSLETRVTSLERADKESEVIIGVDLAKGEDIIEGNPQVGDKIRIVDVHQLSTNRYKTGDIFAVQRVKDSISRPGKVVYVDEVDQPIFEEEFVIVERPALKEPELQVGDFAKVVKLGGHSRKIGDIVRLTVSDGSFVPYEDGISAFFKDQLVKATDAEVQKAQEQAAEAKRAQAEAELLAKWAEIGRKRNEFREGDIVRVIDTMNTTHLTEGQITEVVEPDGTDYPDVKSNDGRTRYAQVELITPVERRFDLKGGQLTDLKA